MIKRISLSCALLTTIAFAQEQVIEVDEPSCVTLGTKPCDGKAHLWLKPERPSRETHFCETFGS